MSKPKTDPLAEPAAPVPADRRWLATGQQAWRPGTRAQHQHQHQHQWTRRRVAGSRAAGTGCAGGRWRGWAEGRERLKCKALPQKHWAFS